VDGVQSKKNIILAVAKLQLPEAENDLKTYLNVHPDLQESVLYALGQCGSQASLPDLALAAEKVGFAPERTQAVDSYLALIQRVLMLGYAKEAEKAASGLLKKAEKAHLLTVREAALHLLFAANPANANRLLHNALKDTNSSYRNAALTFALYDADEPLCNNLVASLKKSSPALKTDILNGLARLYENPKTSHLINASHTSVIAGLLSDKNASVRQSTAYLLSKIAGDEAINALAKLLNDTNESNIDLSKNALSVTRGNIASAIVPYLSSATDKGKIAILQLLSDRKADEQGKVVFEQLWATSPEVRSVAYSSLKHVVTVDDLSALYSLLEQSSPEYSASVQQSIAAVLKSLPQEKAFETISTQIQKTDKDKQYLYYRIFAVSGNSDALAFIIDRFKTGNVTDRDAAFLTLLDWEGSEASDALLSIAKDAGAASYFDRALERYIKLASSSALTGENRRIFLSNALEVATTDSQKNTILKQLGQTGSYLGLLLAGRYLGQPSVEQEAANAVMNIALNNKHFTGKELRQLLETVSNVLNNPDAGYQREAIRKHLDEMSDETGFVSIFNGKDLTGWKGLVENPLARAKMTPAQLSSAQKRANEQMLQEWQVENGLLVFNGNGFNNICTEKQYGDFEMYVDWRLAVSPEADAGIYLRGTPQVQIWNTARTNVGAQVGSGGLYNNKINPSTPIKPVDNTLGEWNALYIKMVGDRVTVFLNGERVVNNVILENYWDRSQAIFPIEQIELQAHGSKVYYRNLYVKELARPEPFQLTEQEKREGFRILFDGANMHQWRGNTAEYILEDGCISMRPSLRHGGNLYTKDEFGNFVFRFEFQLTPDANNGLGIRTPMEGDAAYVGMELQILDSEAAVYKDLAPYQYHGSVYGIIPAKRGFLKPTGEWNYQEVIADGDRIKITLNGAVILDGNIREAVKNGTPDKQAHPGLFNTKGHIGFLGHGSPVKFKNIRIKELK
jgi:HEAT repeat protein